MSRDERWLETSATKILALHAPSQASRPSQPDRWVAPSTVLDAFAAVVTAQDYYQVLDSEGERIAWLKANNSAAFTIVDTARQAAAARMQETPVDEAPGAVEPEEANA